MVKSLQCRLFRYKLAYNPNNYSYLRIINHSYWSYVHQLSYRKRGPHSVVSSWHLHTSET